MGLHQRENTPSGSEVPSLLPSPLSKPCGSPRPTTTKPVHPSSTENASNFLTFRYFIFIINQKRHHSCSDLNHMHISLTVSNGEAIGFDRFLFFYSILFFLTKQL